MSILQEQLFSTTNIVNELEKAFYNYLENPLAETGGISTEETSETSILEEKPKNVYILLGGTKGWVGETIGGITHSKFNHAAIAIKSNGIFYAITGWGPDGLFASQALVPENYNTKENLHPTSEVHYHTYKVPVTETEYVHIQDTLKESLSVNHRYNYIQLAADGVKLLLKNRLKIDIERYKEDEITMKNVVCSGFVAQILCKNIERVRKWFERNDLSVTGISPSSIRGIPGIKFLFSGTTRFPFSSWCKKYQEAAGLLPN